MTGTLHTLVMVLEVIVFIVTAGVAWFVWHISKRDSNKKMLKQNDKQ